MLGDGDGLFLRVRPHGTKTWRIEYEFNGSCTKYTIGVYDREGAHGNSLPEWLRDGRLSLTQARAIAGNRKDARRAGHDPVAEWETQLAREREDEAARKAAAAAESARPTVNQAIETFMARHMAGKKSAPAIRYRLDRLAAHVGTQKISDVTCKCIEKLTRKDFDACPLKRDVTLRLDELADIWRLQQAGGCVVTHSSTHPQPCSGIQHNGEPLSALRRSVRAGAPGNPRYVGRSEGKRRDNRNTARVLPA